MKAITITQYGSPEVLKVEEREKPVPKPNELLVRVRAASITRADTMMRKGSPYIGRLMLGMTKPKYSGVGTGFSGEVVAVGEAVQQFKVGDRVFGESIFGTGTNAEYVCVQEEGVVTNMPNNLSFEEACSICDGPMTSLNFLRDVGQLEEGQRILIIGASGSLGSAAVQIAKQLGAEVSAVCSGANAVWVKTLGANSVIDYTLEDFTQGNQQYDIIFDTIGAYSFSRCKRSLTNDGVYLSPVFGIGNLVQMLWTSLAGGKKAKFSATGMRPVNELRKMLVELKVLFEKNQLKSIIDKCYSLSEITSAHAYIEKGHKKGNVVLVLSEP